MFSLFKRKRHDPEAIAQAVLRAASDTDIIAGFLKEFASSEKQFPRVILGVVIYADCWAKLWTSKQKDSRVSDAYTGAGEIIASRFKGATDLVRVSDYVVSKPELAAFSLEFVDYFRQRVPLEIGVHPDIMEEVKAHQEAIRSYQMRFETLIRMVILIRNKRMTEEMSHCVTSNMEEQSMIMTLSDTLYEQITGVMPLDLARDFVLWQEWDMSRPRRMEAIVSLMSRLEMELDAL